MPTVFRGGRIVSFDPAVGEPEVLVVADGRIAAAGEAGLAARFPGAEIVELAGRALLPGFIDAHNHLSIAALHPLWADLSAVTDLDELGAALAAQAAREPDAEWIRACNWSEASGLLLDRHVLDRLDLGRPVIVAHYSLHQAALCSRGLDALEIGRSTPDPAGGEIWREGDGAPSGLLIERAWSEAHARSLAAYRDDDRFADLFEARMRRLLADGITCVHDAACSPGAEATYASLRRSRRLPISVLMMPHAEALLGRLDAARLAGAPTGEGDEWLRVGPLKLFADGGVAPALRVTVDGRRGEAMGIEFPGLIEDVGRAVEGGFRVAVHAIGNLGLAAAVTAFRRAPRMPGGGEHRFRIEHACFASPAQARELADLGAVGVVQPGFLDHLGRLVEALPASDEIWLPFGALAAAGVRLAASSDDPCAFHEPLRTAAHGCTRRTGSGRILGIEQALPYLEWLRLYTAGAAFAGGQEHERGTLTPGKRADLVVLEGGLEAEPPPRVVETWVGGGRAFER